MTDRWNFIFLICLLSKSKQAHNLLVKNINLKFTLTDNMHVDILLVGFYNLHFLIYKTRSKSHVSEV